MEPRIEDQLFEDFRRTGDPAPLAEVFDRTAPELLRIALHLTGDAARAEDLVQATFVVAIESAATFDPDRRLLPWLAGILTNRARALRRRESRAVDPGRLARRSGEDPIASAQDTELQSRLDEAVRTLPEPYQPVLVLYLKHGLNSAEIADALRRPPGTVRSQLVRGLELLRKLLPAGLAIGAFGGAGFTSSRGLAAVRSEVLASAAPAGKSFAVAGLLSLTGAGSVLVMKKVIFSVAVVLVGAACWVAWPNVADPAARPRATAGETASPAVAQPAESRPSDSRVAAEAPDSLPVSQPAPRAFVRGRCVAADGGAPLAGCKVRFDGRDGGSRVSWTGPVVWTDPEPVTTGADGRFEIVFEPPPTYQHHLDIQREGCVPRTARWGAFKPGQVDDLGDILFSHGVEVRGRVVDTDGVPVAKTVVLLMDLPLRIRADAANNNRSGWSDDAGLFKVGVPIPLGTWPITVANQDLHLVQPRSVTVNEGGANDLTVVVRRRASLSGIVVDEAGSPVVREYLWAAITRGATSMASAWTRMDGTFTIYCTSEDLAPVRLKTDQGAYETLEDERFFEWGTKDIRVVLRRTLSFELTIVEELTEKPVEEFAVWRGASRYGGASPHDARLRGTHTGGRVTVDRVPRGKSWIVILPKDPSLAANRRLEIEMVDGGIPPVRIALRRLTPLPVRLITKRGEPVAGSELQLLEPLGEPVTLGARAPDDRWGGSYSPDPEERPDLKFPPRIIAKEETDRDGRAVLFARAGATGLYLRALGPGHMPFLRAGIAIQPGAPLLEIEVPVPSSIHGTLEPAALTAMHPSLVVRQAGEQGFYPSSTSRFAVKPDGSFAIEGLCAGTWEILLLFEAQPMQLRVNMSDTRLDPLRTVTLGGGETSRVVLDGSRLAPGRVQGKALLDGVPATPARVLLRGRSGESSWRSGPFAVDAEGRFRTEPLIPGTYRVLVQDETGGPFAPAKACSELFEVPPAGEIERVFHLQQVRNLKIRILAADGKTPAPQVVCSVATEDFSDVRLTDAEGWLSVDVAGDAEVKLSFPGRVDTAGPFRSRDPPASVVLGR